MPDSSVRIPDDLLDRASELEYDNRSEAVRDALQIGLDQLEAREARAAVGDLHLHLDGLVAAASDEIVGRLPSLVDARVEEALGRATQPETSVLYFVDPSWPRPGEDPSSIIDLRAGVPKTLVVPAVPWMIYAVENMQIRSTEPGVTVARLCSDDGGGRNLLMPGAHPAAHFDGPGTVLAKAECIASPKNLTIIALAETDCRAVFSLHVRPLKDDLGPLLMRGAYAAAPLPGPFAQVAGGRTVDLGTNALAAAPGRLIRVPMNESEGDPGEDHQVFRTGLVNWATIRVQGLVFDDADLETECMDLRIGGGSNLFQNESWNCALDWDRAARFGLRAYPILMAPNAASVTVRGHKGTAPWVLAEVELDLGAPPPRNR